MADTAVMGKIRKLLAMAEESGNASEQERETAMRKAQELMHAHQVSQYELHGEDRPDDIEDWRLEVKGVDKTWIGSLYWNIGLTSFVDGVVSKHGRGYEVWTLYGRPENLEYVRTLGGFLKTWLEKECKVALRVARKEHEEDPFLEGRFNPKAFKRSFFNAAVSRIHSRLAMLKAQADAKARNVGTGLVRVEGAALEKYRDQRWPTLRKTKQRQYRNFQGAMAGRDAGQRANLSPGLGGGGGTKHFHELGGS